MGALKVTRSKDYSDDANTNAGGRATIDPTGLDGEIDDVVTATDDHADRLDILLRSDLFMSDDFLQGHEFSALAVTVLGALLNMTGFLNWKGEWAPTTAYVAGDLVNESSSGSAYICLVNHISGVFATDLTDLKWQLFAAGASAGLPALVANKVLGNNGAALDWRSITTTEAPTLAPLANPVMTGVVGLPDINVAGRMNFSVDTVVFAAGGNAFNFDTEFIKTIDVSADYTGTCNAANITVGDVMEVHMTNTKGSDAALLWDANWVWMGYAPAVLPSGKKAVLSLRAPTGSAATDVVAMWSVEP